MSCKIFKSLFSSSLNLSIAESNLLLFNFDFFIARIFIWFCLISSRLTVSCIFSVFSKSFFIFLKHIKPSYLISCVWLFQYQFFIALVCYLFCLCFSVEFLIVSSVLPSLDPVIPSRWAAGFLSQWDESSEFYKYLTAVLVEAPTTAVTLCWDLDPWFKKKKKKHRKVEVMLFRELREAYTHNLK